MTKRNTYTLGELARLLDVELIGDADISITGLATLANAREGKISFLANPKYQSELESTQASAVILSAELADSCPSASLVATNPYFSYAKASQLFAVAPTHVAYIHPSAVIDPSANIDVSASIGANAVVEAGARVGANTVIGSGSVVGQGCEIGQNCRLYANVSVYHGVSIGDRVTLHSGVVIGSDGFGFAPSLDRDTGGWEKIEQLGGVRIGDDVEIGAGTTVDRGALDDTVIGNRVILDNQVQIAHNVELGDNTAIAGCTAIAGSTRVGKNCTIAGGCGVVGHLSIADGVHVTAMSLVTKSISQPGSYSSGTSMQETGAWRKNAVRFSQLDTISKRLNQLEKKLD